MLRRLALFALLSAPLAAQQPPSPTGGAQVSTWFMYFGDHPLSTNASIHLETQLRRTGTGQRWEQLLVRPGFGYKLPHGFAALGGYTYFRNYPFEGGTLGPATTTGDQPEHQIFEELSFKHPLGPDAPHTPKLTHRFRNEQRFQGTSTAGLGTTDWKFAERARYRLTADIPLNEGLATLYPNYISTYNELFAQYGPHAKRIVDQNRTYAALGWTLTRTTQLEVGYLHQYMPTPNGIVGVHNHAVQFTIKSTAPFRRGLSRKPKK